MNDCNFVSAVNLLFSIMWFFRVEVPINQMSPVTCVDCHKDGNLGAVGTAAGFSLIFHLKTGKILGRFDTEIPPEAPHAEEDLDSVESVSFSSTMPLLGVGMLSGRVDLWDVNTHSQRLR